MSALTYLSNRSKHIGLIAGFGFAVVGFLWSFAVTDRVGEEIRQLSNTKASITSQIDTINRVASDYFIANQQGDLIFMLALQDNARKDLAGLVYQGNMLDRATPVRNMIGALAIAKQLDFRQTYDAYAQLNEVARKNLTLENFQRLKSRERELVEQGTARVPLLLDQSFQIERTLNADEAAQKTDRLLGQIASMIGALILLCVNLLGMRAGTA